MQGQKNLEAVSRLIMSELTPLVSAHHGAFFMMDADGGRPMLKLTDTYAYRERKGVAESIPARRGPGRPVRAREEEHPADQRAARLHPHQLGPRRGAAAQHHRAADSVRGRGQGGDRAGVVQHLQRDPPDIPRSAEREHRRRAQHDHAPTCAPRSCSQQSQSLTQELQNQSKELTDQQDDSEAHQHGARTAGARARGKGQAARGTEHQGRGQEPRSRAGAQVARRKGRAARADLEVQVRVPRQHVARVAHAAEQPADPGQGAVRQQGGEPHATSNSSTPARSTASGTDLLKLINEILDLSKVEAGKMAIEVRQLQTAELADFAERSFRTLAEEKGLGFSIEVAPGVAPELRTDRQRIEQVLRNLLANAIKFTENGSVTFRMEMVAAAARLRERRPQGSRPNPRALGHRHRNRNRQEQAAADFRGVPASRRQHQPALRRHRSRPLHQPRDRARTRRRDSRREHSRRRQHLHALHARQLRQGDRTRSGRARMTPRRRRGWSIGSKRKWPRPPAPCAISWLRSLPLTQLVE